MIKDKDKNKQRFKHQRAILYLSILLLQSFEGQKCRLANIFLLSALERGPPYVFCFFDEVVQAKLFMNYVIINIFKNLE